MKRRLFILHASVPPEKLFFAGTAVFLLLALFSKILSYNFTVIIEVHDTYYDFALVGLMILLAAFV